MFVRGGMEDDVRTNLRDEITDNFGVLNVDKPARHTVNGSVRFVGKTFPHFIQQVLGSLDESEALRLEREDLACQLGSDRAAGTGDEHALSFEQRAHRIARKLDSIASHEIFKIHGTQLRHVNLATHQLIDPRHGLECQIGFGKMVDDFADSLTRGAWDCDQRFIGASVIGDGGDFGDGAGDFDSPNVRVPLRALVVDETDDLHAQLWAMFDLTRERLAGVTGTDDEHALLFSCLTICGAKMVAAETDQDSRSEKKQDSESPIDQQNRAR